MKICVLSASPKGINSITYQTILYLEKLYPEYYFSTLQVGNKIKSFEKDFSEAKSIIENSDLIIFCYPVYTFIAPYQLHRFIELMKENNVNVANKCAIQITTSKHFYDVTAHKFIKDNCDDLKLNYLGGLSLDMEDLLTKNGQNDVIKFFDLIMYRYENKIYLPKEYNNQVSGFTYECNNINNNKTDEKKIVIVSSASKDDETLNNMIDDFIKLSKYECKVINLRDFKFLGGCLGCLNCATSGKCIYKDGFDEFLRNNINNNDCIVYAFNVSDHSMGSLMKLYDDRQFCNGHRTVTMGKPVGYIVKGNLTNENNLLTIMKARADVGGNFLAGIANDKSSMNDLVNTLQYSLINNTPANKSFYGIGGTIIFRDLIWLMQGIMKEDHKFFKKHGLYDFPQKKRRVKIKMKFAGMIMSNKKIMKKMGNKISEAMILPYKEVIENANKNK